MKILQISTYDLDKNNHGGMIRANQIKKALLRKHAVETLSFEWDTSESMQGFKVTLSEDEWRKLNLSHIFKDWGINSYLRANQGLLKKIKQKISFYNPDLLLIEQPFLYPLVDDLFREHIVSISTPMVYSSHNIETDMKLVIYKNELSELLAKSATDLVSELELACIKKAIFSMAVCEKDAEYIRNINSNIEVQVRPNGHEALITENSSSIKIGEKKSLRNWIYVGSAHPPNIKGLTDFIKNINCLKIPENFRITIIGSVGTSPDFLNAVANQSTDLFHVLGLLDKSKMNEIISQATGIILPIWEGGGSNLKTAQALLSGKYIAASQFAFRGFEKYCMEPGIFISDNPARLARHVLKFSPNLSYIRSDAVNSLTWEKIMFNLENDIEFKFIN